jgi:hypothetical protein
MQAIAKLSAQQYVDLDARRAKAELAGGSADGPVGGRSDADHPAAAEEPDLPDSLGR